MYRQGTALLILLFTISTNSFLFSQNVQRDVIYLKNGSIVKGTITEINPQENVKISTADGNIFAFPMTEVEKIGKTEPEPIMQEPQSNAPQYAPQITPLPKEIKSPTKAFLYSALFPGIGQFYNGNTSKGKTYMLWGALSAAAIIVGNVGNDFTERGQSFRNRDFPSSDPTPNTNVGQVSYVQYSLVSILGILSYTSAWIAGMVDAYTSARRINEEHYYKSLSLGERSTLSLKPDFRLIPVQGQNFNMTVQPTMGISLRLSF